MKLLEIIPEALFEAGASASTRLYAFDLCRALTKNLTAVELYFVFAESVLPQHEYQNLRAFAKNHYPLLFLSVEHLHAQGDGQ